MRSFIGDVMRVRAAILILMVAIAICGCTSASTTPSVQPSEQPPAQPSASVTIQNFAFSPGEVTIAKGGTVTWTNHDSTTHTVTFGDGSSPDLDSGATYERTFNDTGTFSYHCSIHPSMTGKVVVV